MCRTRDHRNTVTPRISNVGSLAPLVLLRGNGLCRDDRTPDVGPLSGAIADTDQVTLNTGVIR